MSVMSAVVRFSSFVTGYKKSSLISQTAYLTIVSKLPVPACPVPKLRDFGIFFIGILFVGKGQMVRRF